jgi:hypothetical protein
VIVSFSKNSKSNKESSIANPLKNKFKICERSELNFAFYYQVFTLL